MNVSFEPSPEDDEIKLKLSSPLTGNVAYYASVSEAAGWLDDLQSAIEELRKGGP